MLPVVYVSWYFCSVSVQQKMDRQSKTHLIIPNLFFYMPLSPHPTICSPSSSIPSPSNYLHVLFNLLSTDTAIINHGKEHSRSRLLAAVGRLPACPPARTVGSPSRTELSHRSKNTTLKRTSNINGLPPSVLTHLLQSSQSTNSKWTARQGAPCHVRAGPCQPKSKSNPRSEPLEF